MQNETTARAAGGATGPRTAAGRKRVSQNARKHGLTTTAPDFAAIAAQVRSWRHDSDTQTISVSALTALAEARLQIARVQAHQTSLTQHLSAPSVMASETQCEPHEGVTEDQCALVSQFQRTLRYRAEAEARGRKALRVVTQELRANASGLKS